MTIDRNRRRFLCATAALPIAHAVGLATFGAASVAFAGAPASDRAFDRSFDRYSHLLALVELKGGNDGLNTVVPYTDAGYYALRPKLAVARDPSDVYATRIKGAAWFDDVALVPAPVAPPPAPASPARRKK